MAKIKKTYKEVSKGGDDVTGGVDVKIGGKVYKNVTPDFKPPMMNKMEKKTEVIKTPIKKGKKWIPSSNGMMKA